MEIYKSIGSTGYEIIHCVEGYDGWQSLSKLDGTSRKTDWKPTLVRRVRPSKREGFRPADLPYEACSLILRRSAVDALRDILDVHGELLPLEDEGGVELYVFNMRVIDALDRERSAIDYFGEDNRHLWVRRPMFVRSALEGVDVFKQAGVANSIYYSDRFLARVKAAKLKGLDFTKVWSSDEST
jgi:hypothetical protein